MLAGTAVAGQVLFTAAWLLLPLTHDGYSHRRETISVLAAVGAPAWQLMSAGFLACTAGFLAAAVLVAHRTFRPGRIQGLAVPALLCLAAVGTLTAGLARTVCGQDSASWCTPGAGDPLSAAAHGIGAGLAFASLHTAALVVAVTARRGSALEGTRTVSIVVLALSLPHLAWFSLQLDDPGEWFGYAEKVFVTLTNGWAAWLALWCARRIATAPRAQAA